MRVTPLWILSFLFALALAHALENEVKQEIAVIHKNVVKKVPLKKWGDLVNDSISVIIEANSLKNKKLQEQDLVIWNNGKRMNEKYFNSDHFRRGNKNVYVFLSGQIAGANCFTAENIYNTLADQVTKYTGVIKKYLHLDDNASEEWTSMKELLLLLMKSKDLRDLVVGIKTDEHIEAVRQKILELTQKNKNYQIFFDILREHKIVYNILNSKDKWKTFVKENLANLKKLLEPYYANVRADDL
ncbi:hypothetical protein, conserved [Plasmodium vivax]|uniref:Uncharacterized protein n=4 Tax=Plasmodium vivax TaxID=5855 RepID=A5K0M1_PLAVS|nr:hypothetical protein PVX_084640 [Plasmodium vivax]KMZ83655.1 hypothetical protein PVBG_00735 [Plasmodium vivax Brazil I]KMZ97638.1 hypothetical protein PVNG_01375 [Plasmodium vivax North Korean]EDL46868.1 hypothetical protein PVX_084640 [Plasmodium vivax]CAI7722767.1 conserved Plasmodium protein, unknown function [Plasmodium vivax]SCO74700.1 hypothetical protein, conserved [Plasmodium vivax]|eukprot:XP_001616595.1 hypothetical protein [Plasmodium vivax Sal-1]